MGLPKTMFLEVRNGRKKSIINIKYPSIFTITFQSAATAQIENHLFNGPLRVSLVLRWSHVFLYMIYAFLGHNFKLPYVVKFNIDPPAFTVVFQAISHPMLLSMVQNVPVSKCQANEKACAYQCDQEQVCNCHLHKDRERRGNEKRIEGEKIKTDMGYGVIILSLDLWGRKSHGKDLIKWWE